MYKCQIRHNDKIFLSALYESTYSLIIGGDGTTGVIGKVYDTIRAGALPVVVDDQIHAGML